MTIVKNIKLSELKNEKFSLVLSGGSSLGIAHLGVIKYLNEHSIKPNEIIGTSMGAIIGAGFACGKTFDELNLFLENSNLLNWAKYSYANFSLVSTKKVKKLLFELIGNLKFIDLNFYLKIVATNLNTGLVEVFSKSTHPNIKILDAVLASMAIPLIFEPIKIENNIYVDGYLSSNFSFEFSENDLILGVDVIAKKYLSHLKPNKNLLFKKFKNLVRLFGRAFFIQIKNQTRLKLHELPKSKKLILIEPEISNYNTFDYDKNNEILDKGYQEMVNYFEDKNN